MLPFPLSRQEVERLIELDSSPSTNSQLTAMVASEDLPDLTTVVTINQSAGRGRLDRDWITPAGTALAISVLVRTRLPSGDQAPPQAWGWLPLAAGVAMTDAVCGVVSGSPVGFKWPNDVQVDGKKVCGILAEVVPGGVVIGAGINVTMTADQLPVPSATSLVLAGAEPSELFDRLLARYLRSLAGIVLSLWATGGDAEASGLRAAAGERCATLGREVRAELPGGAELTGTAIGIDLLGRLEIRTRSGRVEPVAAGDIIHLR